MAEQTPLEIPTAKLSELGDSARPASRYEDAVIAEATAVAEARRLGLARPPRWAWATATALTAVIVSDAGHGSGPDQDGGCCAATAARRHSAGRAEPRPNVPIFIACCSGGRFLFTPNFMWLDKSDVELLQGPQNWLSHERNFQKRTDKLRAVARRSLWASGRSRGARQARSRSRGTSGSASLAGSTVVPL
ncbi:hypothetical protein GCM10020218_016130 [Dactylosporangium vinaceum]